MSSVIYVCSTACSVPGFVFAIITFDVFPNEVCQNSSVVQAYASIINWDCIHVCFCMYEVLLNELLVLMS